MRGIFWSDFHSNIHSNQLPHIKEWYEFAKEMLDFWAPVYYPYFINHSDTGFEYEDTLPEERYKEDFDQMKEFLYRQGEDFILYPAYEWQGDGRDGDHNVFFQDFSQDMVMPLTYRQLYEAIGKGNHNVMAIPHHTGYAPGHRGKNWETNEEEFSPVMEIYSSHGSSEDSEGDIPLNVHIHMGPRSERGTLLWALRKGIKTGIIASGDNHSCPAISGNGFFAVISDEYSREAIFQAIRDRHTYGVLRSRIQLDYTINDQIMGGQTADIGENKLHIHVIGSSAIDRIELYRNGILDRCYVHSGTWERKKLGEVIRFKFEVEFGWGPDRRLFPDIEEKIWNVKIETQGTILGVEKLWSYPGAKICCQEAHSLEAEILTRKNLSGKGKLAQKNYLTPNIQNQSMILEIEARKEDTVNFMINGKKFSLSVNTLLQETTVRGEEEVTALLRERADFIRYYREDPWWHNTYKVLIHRASPSISYEIDIEDIVTGLERKEDSFFVKIIQKNGDTAWSSPIWINS